MPTPTTCWGSSTCHCGTPYALNVCCQCSPRAKTLRNALLLVRAELFTLLQAILSRPVAGLDDGALLR